ncbi:MAG: hypothetical protein PUG48_00550 [Clostridia bacterium]|nr:hypothetical protein [Clostridia bacterium]
MKTKIKRLTALILAVIAILNITACSNVQKWDGKWKITDDDYDKSIFADSKIEKGKDTITVTINSDKTTFKSDISKDSIRIAAFTFSGSIINVGVNK